MDLATQPATPAAPSADPADIARHDMGVNDRAIQTQQPSLYPLSFTGTGAEYFRIWIVNTLLTIITLGIYLPWAKVRKRQYLARNLHFDGASFDFHGSPVAVLKGWVIAAVLLGIYAYVTRVHPSLFAVGGFILCLLVFLPWLVWKSMRFNLSNSSYRALRFQFTGTLSQAYAALIPIILLFVLPSIIGILIKLRLSDSNKELQAANFMFMLLYLVALPVYPVLHYRLKRYQHSNYHWASLQTNLRSSSGVFFDTWLKYSLKSALVVVVMLVIFSAIGLVLGGLGVFGKSKTDVLIVVALLGILFYPVMLAVNIGMYHGYFQDLIWNSTSANGIQFHSQLKDNGVVRAYVKNAVFVALTLGFYWPFAYIALLKLRVQACSVTLDQPSMQLAQVQLGQTREDAAIGDASMDAFDFDIAL